MSVSTVAACRRLQHHRTIAAAAVCCLTHFLYSWKISWSWEIFFRHGKETIPKKLDVVSPSWRESAEQRRRTAKDVWNQPNLCAIRGKWWSVQIPAFDSLDEQATKIDHWFVLLVAKQVWTLHRNTNLEFRKNIARWWHFCRFKSDNIFWTSSLSVFPMEMHFKQVAAFQIKTGFVSKIN